MDDKHYFAARVSEERDMAARCEDNAVARIHLDLADAYDRKVASLKSIAPPVRPATGSREPTLA